MDATVPTRLFAERFTDWASLAGPARTRFGWTRPTKSSDNQQSRRSADRQSSRSQAQWTLGRTQADPASQAVGANAFPEVTRPFCRLPLSTFVYRLEATCQGDRMRQYSTVSHRETSEAEASRRDLLRLFHETSARTPATTTPCETAVRLAQPICRAALLNEFPSPPVTRSSTVKIREWKGSSKRKDATLCGTRRLFAPESIEMQSPFRFPMYWLQNVGLNSLSPFSAEHARDGQLPARPSHGPV